MKCNICGKEKAVLYIQEIIGNERRQIHICKECEINGNIIEKCLELEFNNIDTIFPNYKSLPSKKKKKKTPHSNKICKVCGYSLDDFLKTGVVSCPKCYEYFKSEISKHIKKIHRENKHIGKISSRNLTNKDIESKINKYREEIELFIKIEKYEEAALIRDKLEHLKKDLISKKTKSEKKDVR
ncbi:excinuclease ABC subunit B [Brachyspira suanatina]|uniref:Excinuclease ABC subunit B n=1 Tax=Brachyspira suanatina TaxID=381802 RepID=A0A0G4K9R2_9SPIR|nr:excinuclease ABC subunit B [Brachyspira suanatina]CRF34970.1 excinuclease ABC subunit B [Brachyspira suanatina]